MTEQAVLVVIDMQNGFVNRHSKRVVPKIVDLVERCARQNVPVVFTRFINEVGSSFERLMGWTDLRNSPEVDIVAELAPFATIVIEKRQYSAFTPEFMALVQARGWKRLFFCGVATEACVSQTAVDAFERNMTPVVIHDACASDDGDDVHEAGLTVIARLIGSHQIVDAAGALDWSPRRG